MPKRAPGRLHFRLEVAMRRFGVGLVIVAAIAVLFWAGVKNYKHRQMAMQQKQEQIVLVKDGTPPTDSGTMEIGTALQGKAAPDFTLTSLDGTKVSLSQLKGHPVLINFWATWCGPCQLEMPWFQEFAAKYKDKGFVVLGIDQDDEDMPKSTLIAAVKKIGVTYPILLPSKTVAKDYKLGDYLPETFIVNRDGVVVEHSMGAPSKDAMEAKIEKAL
ncbi:MAG: TlpA disulfide reductase family protein [Bryocella sp.]